MALRLLSAADLSALHRAGRPWRGALGLRLALAAALLVIVLLPAVKKGRQEAFVED